MPQEFIEPGNVKKIFLEYFLGSPDLLFFAILVLISFLSAKFQMSNRNFMIILVVSSLIFAGLLGQAIYILILIVTGFVIFKGVGRYFT